MAIGLYFRSLYQGQLERYDNGILRPQHVVLYIIKNATYCGKLKSLLQGQERFYVNFEFRPTVHHYIDDFIFFAPWYSVLAIAVFIFFRLYGGMWRYAGINDLNRIIFANLATTVIQVVGTLIIGKRMPITYYIIGEVH